MIAECRGCRVRIPDSPQTVQNVIVVVSDGSVIIMHLFLVAGQVIHILPDLGAVVSADRFQTVVVIVYEFV